MNNQDYEQKKKECWLQFCREKGIDKEVNISIYEAFDSIFDRAYSLGKQEKKAKSMQLSDVKQKIDAWMDSHTEEEVYECLKKYGAVEDEDTITIDKEEYDELCKYRRYVANWVHYLTVCPICGEYNPNGCICSNCNNDKNWNNEE